MTHDLTDTHPHYLFVYGTLKQGNGNNVVIQRRQGKYIGPAKTVEKFVLSDGFPYVWKPEAAVMRAYTPFLGQVVGDLFKVTHAGLEDCDRLEGHPRHYCRTPITVTYGPEAQAKTVTAGIYLIQREIHPDDLQEPKDGLLEWGRDEPKRARDFQRNIGRRFK